MIIDNTTEIKTNPLFERLIQPLNEKEILRLKENIMSSESIPTISTWRNTHLTDKYLYNICLENDLPYTVSEKYFEDLSHAAIYVCTVQLSRENLTHEYRKYLIGQKFGYMTFGTDETKQADTRYNTAAALGHELYLSAGTVMKYYQFSTAVNEVFDQSNILAQKILMGKVRISHENIMELVHLMPDEIKAVANSVINDKVKHLTLSYIRNEAKWSHIQTRAVESRKEKIEKKAIKNAAIHQMPQYDPDSEANSLCMTIDSWISSIQRVHNSENFSKITPKASLQLMKKLSFLEHTVNVMQESLVERNNI